jgi:hypothetical protein
MQHIVNPRQTNLFDPFKHILSTVAYRRIRQGWQGVFRHAILELMLADVLAGEFSPNMGTPTKELYSMADLLLIKEFMDWTKTEAAEAYMFHAEVQYALNLEPANQSLCERTIERCPAGHEPEQSARDPATEAMRRCVAEKLVRTVWSALLKPVGALRSLKNRLKPPQRVAWPDLHTVRPNSGPEPYRLVA